MTRKIPTPTPTEMINTLLSTIGIVSASTLKSGSAMVIRINNTTGEAVIWVDPSTLSTEGRIYFSHTYICTE